MQTPRLQYRINLAQLRANFAYLQKLAGGCQLMPVVKYDAYGMGALKIAGELQRLGAARFAVANCDEALELLPLGAEIQILGVLPPEEMAPAVAHDLICPVYDRDEALMLSREAVRQQKKVRIAVKLDTGMGRLGFIPEESLETIAEILTLPGLCADGIYAHFAKTGLPDLEYSQMQIDRFLTLLQALEKRGFTFLHIHHAASDAILNFPAATQSPFNMARPGWVLYGESFAHPCQQVCTLTTRVGALRRIGKGRSVGYFGTFTAEKPTAVALIEAGYADGIPLALSNRGSVLIRGQRCPILGRVSMDYTVVDVSALPEVQTGDQVVLFGRQQNEAIPVCEWGRLKSTHTHEIWCSIGHRCQRVYC